MKDLDGVIRCDHTNCWRRAVRVVSYEVPKHPQFRGQPHDCCAVHSKPTKAEKLARDGRES